MTVLKIGTRGSPLALWQANWVAERLRSLHPAIQVEIVTIVTSADRHPRGNLTAMGGKGLFVKEIEEALLARQVDLAVHSLKDIPGDLAPGLVLAAVPPRDDPGDALISRSGQKFFDLPAGARVATSSLRRACQLKALRPDSVIVPIRGNIGTRLDKIGRGEAEATVLAVAGLKRLGWETTITEVFGPDRLVPAIGQGALGLETRAGSTAFDQVRSLDDPMTRSAVTAERALARGLAATCRTPVGGYAEKRGTMLALTGVVASLDGQRVIRDQVTGPADQAEGLGLQLAEQMLSAGADGILKEIER